jgi:arabinan endo-1,5-alpha-L-arabinosidase
MKTFRHFLPVLLLLLLAGCRPVTAPAAVEDATPAPVAPAATHSTATNLEPQGFVQRIHDPVIAKEGDTYYVFSTGARIIVICSKDMVVWEWCGRVFERAPAWVNAINPGVIDLWAPDISYFNGKWHLYYSGSTFGSQNSVIGLATNATLDPNSPDFAWVDQGEVLRSQPGDDWNAIDANLVVDADGQPWLAFGSYWSGIKLRKIDAATGKLAGDDTTLYSLANRRAGPDNADSIEAAFIVHRGDYYYLFTSFDFCCRGAQSTYNVRVGRASEVTGPYVDRDGVPMLEGGGTKILDAYDHWRGPGHNAVFAENGVDWIVYHAYDAQLGGISKLRIDALHWDEEGWPSVAR